MNAKAIKKYRPYLTYPELLVIHTELLKANNSPEVLMRDTDQRRNLTSAEYVISSLLRDIAYEKKSPDITTSGRTINASVTSSDMFNEQEVASVRKSDKELLANASEYEQDVIFLKETLEAGFITQEEFETKLAEFKMQHNIKE